MALKILHMVPEQGRIQNFSDGGGVKYFWGGGVLKFNVFDVFLGIRRVYRIFAW